MMVTTTKVLNSKNKKIKVKFKEERMNEIQKKNKNYINTQIFYPPLSDDQPFFNLNKEEKRKVSLKLERLLIFNITKILNTTLIEKRKIINISF